ncbi:20625_t:CDS:2 [Dentiscutata erythropus]|uniref:20625_t:CDS:1 n=1 Tax=Dentiscutata erythropus TaxID=1348616 RepID=A0A9N8YWB3_9GLOM|nr:20625_t:CDS:2 [Dentiscutata erythropus]
MITKKTNIAIRIGKYVPDYVKCNNEWNSFRRDYPSIANIYNQNIVNSEGYLIISTIDREKRATAVALHEKASDLYNKGNNEASEFTRKNALKLFIESNDFYWIGYYHFECYADLKKHPLAPRMFFMLSAYIQDDSGGMIRYFSDIKDRLEYTRVQPQRRLLQNESVMILTRASDKGDITASRLLGKIYFKGIFNREKNYHLADHYLSHAVAERDYEAYELSLELAEKMKENKLFIKLTII